MPFELEADLSIGVALGEKLDNMADVLKKGPPRPLLFPVKGSNNGIITGAFRIGSPPTGKIWNILSLMITGVDDHTAVTGTFGLYVDSDNGNLSIAECIVPNITAPYFTTFSKGTLWAHAQGDVVVNQNGLSANQQVVVNMTVAEWFEKDVTARYV